MAHINLRPLWAVLFSLALAIPSYAQVTIWSEDFSGYAPGTMNAPGLWTSTGTDCDDPGLNIGNQFGVFGGQFVVNEVEGAPCCSPAGGGNDNSFETVPINISGYCTVEFSMNTGSSGDLECLSAGMPLWGCTGVTATDDFHDQMVIEYDLDGTTFQAAYFCGDNGVGPVSVTGLMGNTLVIRIFAANKFGNETYTFDDILVQGILPQAPALNIPQTTFCQTGASVPLGNVQSGVSGTWSGVGVSANQFNPTLAGPGTFTLTFTPAPGQCALPNTIQVSVTAAPQAFTASDQACLTGPAAIFDLTTLNSIVNGGSGAPVSWYLDPNANVPINNPSSYATPVTSNVYAVVTVGGCNSFPVAVTLTINTCNVMPPVLACNPAGSQSVCEICEDDMTPNEVVNLYVFFQNPPPQGYDFVLTYGNSQSGFQTFNVMDYTGGPLPFTITDTTIFYISSLTCPNGCSDFIGLGNQVVFVYNQAPVIDDPGDLEGCGSVVLPPITGMNIPGDAAYYTQPNGGGTAYLPGQTVNFSGTLYLFADNGGCVDEVSVMVNVDSGFDPAWTAPAGLCSNDGPILLSPDGTPGGSWSGTGVTDNGDGTALFDPAAPGAGSVTYTVGAPPCDTSLMQVILIGMLSDTTLVDLFTCDPAQVGMDTTSLQNQTGCDSVVVTTTSLLPGDTIFLAATSCDSLQVGTDTLFLQNQAGCDSLVITTTSLLPGDTIFLAATSCDPLQVGTDTLFLQNQAGCDSLVITTTSLLPGDTIFLAATSCDPLQVGTDTLFLQNQAGCDSLVITTTSLLPGDTIFLAATSCDPLQVGTDTLFLQNQAGCDSLVITTTQLVANDTTFLFGVSCNPVDTGTVVTVLAGSVCDSVLITTTALLPSDTTFLTAESCDPAQVGADTLFLNNIWGCDSLVITTTSLLPSDTTLLTDLVCDPGQVGQDTLFLNNQFGCDSLVITTNVLTAADTTLVMAVSCSPLDTGTVVQVFAGSQCDSIVITTTSLLPSDATLLTAGSCDPAAVGVDTVFLTNQFGCDSLVITTTSLLPSDETLLTAGSCDLAQVGVDTVFLTNQFGCDSLVITTTSLLPSDATLLTAGSCDPAQVGVDTVFLTNQFGCDSLVITTTSLLPGSETLLTAGSCDPSAVGVDTVFLTNQFGCDSLVITTTSLLPSDATLLTAGSCDPAQVGVDTVFLTNQFGCDSLVITTTSLLPSDLTFEQASTCDPLQVGTDTTFLANQFGCDSLVVTTTTLLPPEFTFLTAGSCDPAQVGIDTVLLSNQMGCDSLVITTTSLLPSDQVFLSATSCDPMQVGVDTSFLSNQFGCDSLVITTTSLVPPVFGSVNETVCFGDSILINGTFYSAANPTGIDTLQAASGCDSILTISVTELAPPAQEMIALELCPGETFELNGSIYDENNPSGTETLIGQLSGCDSVLIEVALTFLELEAEWSQIDPTCLEETGYAVLEGVTGAPGPYSYALDGDPFTLVDTFPVIVGPLVPGSYQVLAENADGCLATELITLEPAPALTLDLGEDQIVGLGEVVTLNPVADFQIASLLWSPASVLPCDTCLSLTFAPVNSLLVTATATDAFGCEASDELFIEVNTSIDIFIPNVFSPDFDGANDYFTIFAQEGLIQQIDLLQVYSRWGEKVFENTDFPANSLLDGWDGTFRGERLDPGVYVFYAEVTLLGGEARTLEGSVTLVR